MRISVFWVFDQDTDLHAPLQGLGRLLNLDIETRDIVLYKKQTKKMKRNNKGVAYYYLNRLKWTCVKLFIPPAFMPRGI